MEPHVRAAFRLCPRMRSRRHRRLLVPYRLILPNFADPAQTQATQAVVENMLYRRQGKTRHDLGRAAFVELAHEWKVKRHYLWIDTILILFRKSITRKSITLHGGWGLPLIGQEKGLLLTMTIALQSQKPLFNCMRKGWFIGQIGWYFSKIQSPQP